MYIFTTFVPILKKLFMGRKEFYEKMEELHLIRWFSLNHEDKSHAERPASLQRAQDEKEALHLKLSLQKKM